jgi:hypothetical protein
MIQVLTFGCGVDRSKAASKIFRDGASNFQCFVSGIDV